MADMFGSLLDSVDSSVGSTGSVLSGIAQYYQSEKMRKANQNELDNILKIFEAIKPPNYDVSVTSPPQYIASAVPPEAIDYSKLTPEQFKQVGQFAPQTAAFIAEKNPQLAQNTQFGVQGKQAQSDALSQYMNTVKDQGMDPMMANQLQMAKQSALGAANAQNQSVLQGAQRRGQLGSGTMMAAQLSGGENAMNRASQQDMQAAAEAYQNKMNALRGASSLGGQMQQSDFSQQQANANILNDFNMRTSRNANAYAQYVANQGNEAQKYNLGQAQDVANKNTAAGNQYQQLNRNAYNNAQQTQYQNALQERNYQNSIKDKQYQNQLNAQQRSNSMLSQIYGNQLTQAGAITAPRQQQIKMNIGNTQDINRAYQGFGNATSSAFGYRGKNPGNMNAPENGGGGKNNYEGADMTGSGDGTEMMSDNEGNMDNYAGYAAMLA